MSKSVKKKTYNSLKPLTKEERKYIAHYLNGDWNTLSKEGLTAVLKAEATGRIEADRSNIAKEWVRRMNVDLSEILLARLMEKRARKENLSEEDLKILRNYEENDILPIY